MELELLLRENKLDIILLSETHMNDHKNLTLKGYKIYCANHPDGTCHAGAAVVIKDNIKHHLQGRLLEDHLQAVTVTVMEKHGGSINISAAYCPPRHNIKEEMFSSYFRTLGTKFISGGDWNSKHTHWGSRLVTTRGRELKKCIDTLKLNTLSTGEPTYWPTDPAKIPDLLDFFVIKGVGDRFTRVETCLDISSDHSAVIGIFRTIPMNKEQPLTLCNKQTDWDVFADLLDREIDLNVKLKTSEDIDSAALYITKKIQEAAWRATPLANAIKNKDTYIPKRIRQKLKEKRKLRRRWHYSRLPEDKKAFNRCSRQLKKLLKDTENEALKQKLTNLSATAHGTHSLWKITKNLKRPQEHLPPLRSTNGTWAQTPMDKANIFAEYLKQVFTPNQSPLNEFEEEIDKIISSDQQLSIPLKPVTPTEVFKTIKSLKNKKAPGYDLITGEILKKLPKKAIIFLNLLFNGIMRVLHFPSIWKFSIVKMTLKPGKPSTLPSSYRPISLLPTLSKVFEKVLLPRLQAELKDINAIPDHQFGFRPRHSTIEQVHRVVHKIRRTLERKEYCSAVFLDIQQAFDKVWHKGLLFKLKNLLSNTIFMILKSYLQGRKFQAKIEEALSSICDIEASVPQGSVLGPVLYSIYTADIPTTDNVETATYADDTACLASDTCPHKASDILQVQLDKIHTWMEKWRIKASSSKSTHVTFSLRKEDCKPVTLAGESLPHKTAVKYLGFTLDRRLTWSAHIKAKKNEVNMQLNNLNWLLGKSSQLSLHNKMLVYKCILKPIWSYGIELWGSASNSNLEVLQRFQNKALRTISNAPRFTRNTEIHEHLNILTVKEEAKRHSIIYKNRLREHVNILARALINRDNTQTSRLKRLNILDIDKR